MARVNPAPVYGTNNDDLAMEDPDSGMAWSAIFGGALAAIAITMILSPLGTALGFSLASPWHQNNDAGKAITASAAIWLIVVQWISSGFGGYLTGRLRTKWVGAHTHEVFFRDTAHGFLSWALATVVGVAVIVGVMSNMSGAMGHGMAHHEANASSPEAYYTDSLFRTHTSSSDAVSDQDRAEATRIMTRGLAKGGMSDNDRIYLSQLVQTRTGLTSADADQRVSNVMTEQKAALDAARKTAAEASIFLCLALLLGAFIASIGGALGGRHRDIHYETGSLRVS
jgi:hypothetical protein